MSFQIIFLGFTFFPSRTLQYTSSSFISSSHPTLFFLFILLELVISLRPFCVNWSCLRIVSKVDQVPAHTIGRDIAASNSLSLSVVKSWRWCVNAVQMHFLARMDDEIQGTSKIEAQVIRSPGVGQKIKVRWGPCDCNEKNGRLMSARSRKRDEQDNPISHTLPTEAVTTDQEARSDVQNDRQVCLTLYSKMLWDCPRISVVSASRHKRPQLKILRTVYAALSATT